MLFSSIVFLFTFLPAVLVLYYLLPERFHNPVLLLASLIFYAWGEPVYIFLMLLSILFNYFSGLDIARNLTDRRLAKRSLIFNIVVNIAILGFFKYFCNDCKFFIQPVLAGSAHYSADRYLILYIPDIVLYYRCLSGKC